MGFGILCVLIAKFLLKKKKKISFVISSVFCQNNRTRKSTDSVVRTSDVLSVIFLTNYYTIQFGVRNYGIAEFWTPISHTAKTTRIKSYNVFARFRVFGVIGTRNKLNMKLFKIPAL